MVQQGCTVISAAPCLKSNRVVELLDVLFCFTGILGVN
jgi:hypothetical protein